MAHGYLLCSFLSRFSNLRKDRYGGDIAGRSRFSLEVLKAVRSRVGRDFPVICRLSGDEYVQNGLKLEETKQIAAILEREGADALHISACNAASVYLNHPPYYVPEGVFVHLAEAIKAEVSIPVIAVGRIRSPLMAEEIIREGRADLVSMGRALIADPQLPKKAEQGSLDEIVPCISCNRCIQNLRKGALRCAVNPETGNETQFKLSKTKQPKKIWIVGGGPGGLKAAEIAARRGHQVKVFEKGDRLGGRMRLASVPPKKAVLKDFIDYLERKVKNLGVTLELGKEFTVDMLSPDEPQAVIVATGAVPRVPDWKGINDSGAVTVDEILLSGGAQVGEKVLVVGGGGVGAEAADFLSEMGKEVTIVEMLEEIASDLVTHLQHYLLERLREKRVSFLTSTRVEQLGRGYAVVEDSSGTRQIKGFDNIVLALGATPDDRIAKSLAGKIRQLYVIGDAVKPREVLEAVYEGEEIALKI
jgi:NADPH-dependent 2,4-dienoyl-CoA reductase/sulfur reductase-like enzyme